jgi:hypothetical protein
LCSAPSDGKTGCHGHLRFTGLLSEGSRPAPACNCICSTVHMLLVQQLMHTCYLLSYVLVVPNNSTELSVRDCADPALARLARDCEGASWRRASAAYTPSLAISSSWLPCSTTTPLRMTAIMSAERTVLRRCATMMTVRPRMSVASASCTSASLSASRALVASSSSSTAGSRTRARAMAILCRHAFTSMRVYGDSTCNVHFGHNQ